VEKQGGSMNHKVLVTILSLVILALSTSCGTSKKDIAKFEETTKSISQVGASDLEANLVGDFKQEYEKMLEYPKDIQIKATFSGKWKAFEDAIIERDSIRNMTEPSYAEPTYSGPFHFIGELIAPVKDGGFVLRDLEKKYYYVTGALAQDLLSFNDDFKISLYFDNQGGSTGFTIQGLSISANNVKLSSKESFNEAQASHRDEIKKAKADYGEKMKVYKTKDKNLSVAQGKVDQLSANIQKEIQSGIYTISSTGK